MAPDDEQQAEWKGLDLYDLDGEKIGKVEEVRGDATGGLGWVVIETGFLGTKKMLVPAGEVRRSGDRLSVPFTKDRVKDAPEVGDEMAPTEEEKGKICRYYGLQYPGAAGQPGEGCEEMDKEDIRAAG